MNSPPLLTVLTPSFGYAQFISDCLTSVSIAGVPVEHIVADGGSTDGTVEQLRNHQVAEGSRLQWWSRPDLGQSDALNQALAASTGTWVGWLNADEYYLHCGLKAMVDRLTTTDADVVTGECLLVDADRQPLRLLGSHRPSRLTLQRYGCVMTSCSTFVRRDALGAEPFDTRCRFAMDWDLFLTLLHRNARFEFVPITVAGFRVHDAQVTASPPPLMASEYQYIRSKHGLPTNPASVRIGRTVGRVGRVTAKVGSGAYWRQLRTRREIATGGQAPPHDVGP